MTPVTMLQCQTKGYLIKPIGGHASFQSKIHGIKAKDTKDKPNFRGLFPEIQHVFSYPLIAHSLFDKQVLNALSEHFNLGLRFEYIDSCSLAKEKLPDLKNCKLPTLAKHFGLPAFKHHDATEDAITCAKVYLKLREQTVDQSFPVIDDENEDFQQIVMKILADDEVNYKEVCELLYWLEDHAEIIKKYLNVYIKLKNILDDDVLDNAEAKEMKILLTNVLKSQKVS